MKNFIRDGSARITFGIFLRLRSKRRRAAAVQDLAEIGRCFRGRGASWTAAVLRRVYSRSGRPFYLAGESLVDLQPLVTMMTRQQLTAARQRAQDFLRRAGIVLTEAERASIEVADFGLGDLDRIGLEIVTYINTDRCCAKELVLFPHQTCPEHRHPPIGGEPGKEETFRCRWGKVFLYVEGPRTTNPRARPPAGREHTYTVWHELELNPGDQHTIFPDTRHWFQAGPEGAVVSEFSTRSRDESDIFTDASIRRLPEVKD